MSEPFWKPQQFAMYDFDKCTEPEQAIARVYASIANNDLKFQALLAELEETKARVIKKQHQLHALNSEIAKLKKQLQSPSAIGKLTQADIDFSKEYARLEIENCNLKADNERMRRALDEAKDMALHYREYCYLTADTGSKAGIWLISYGDVAS